MALALAAPAGAGEAATSGTEALDALRVSAELARTGRRLEDPWLLAAAARLRRSITVTPVVRAPGGGTVAEAGLRDPSADWIAEARRLGRYDRPLMSMLDALERRIWRGRAGGPRVSRAVVDPAGAHSYAEPFRAQLPAAVYVEGDGDTDLTLRVLDHNGNATCEQTGPGDVKVCSWTPAATGEHTIQVINRGAVANSYALATN